MNTLEAIVLAVIEGITEFLPVSSTGHMIIASAFMGISDDDFAKLFTIVIQLGAILAVIILYWKRFFDFRHFKEMLLFYLKLLVAFIPAAILGKLFYSDVKMLLGNVTLVGIMLLAGGIVFLFIDKVFEKTETAPDKPLTFRTALVVGLFQTLSFIPGVSRAAASIIGGLTQKLNRKQAAEFSFFLAVPTMFAATAKDLYDNQNLLTDTNISLLITGSIVAFIVAAIAIKTFIGFLTKHGFYLFGWYRIILGSVILLLIALGKNLEMI